MQLKSNCVNKTSKNDTAEALNIGHDTTYIYIDYDTTKIIKSTSNYRSVVKFKLNITCFRHI